MTVQWFSPDTQISYTNKTDCHDITEILLKVALSTIKQTNQRIFFHNFDILLKGKPVLRQNIIFFSHYFCIYRTKLYTVVTFQTEIRYKLHGNISTGFHTSKIDREKPTQVHVFSYLTSHYVHCDQSMISICDMKKMLGGLKPGKILGILHRIKCKFVVMIIW
jgi:hypothetical protein